MRRSAIAAVVTTACAGGDPADTDVPADTCAEGVDLPFAAEDVVDPVPLCLAAGDWVVARSSGDDWDEDGAALALSGPNGEVAELPRFDHGPASFESTDGALIARAETTGRYVVTASGESDLTIEVRSGSEPLAFGDVDAPFPGRLYGLAGSGAFTDTAAPDGPIVVAVLAPGPEVDVEATITSDAGSEHVALVPGAPVASWGAGPRRIELAGTAWYVVHVSDPVSLGVAGWSAEAEPNGSAEEASARPASRFEVRGTISEPGDADWYRLAWDGPPPDSNGMLVTYCLDAEVGGTAAIQVDVFDPTGAVVPLSPGGSYQHRDDPGAGPYDVRITSADSGPHVVYACRLGLYHNIE
jgi:hypothetical protein